MVAHIVHIIDELRLGGAQTHLLTMLEASKSRTDIRHSVICLFGENELQELFNSLQIDVHLLRSQLQIQRKRYFSVVGLIKERLSELKATHVECHLTWSRVLGLPAGRLAGIKKCFGFEHGDIYLKSFSIKLFNFVSQFFAEKIILCSEALAKWFSSANFIIPMKILVLHNAISPNKFAKNKSLGKSSFGFDEKVFLFCAAGTMGRGVDKRIDIIIQAAKILNTKKIDFGVVICGDGEQRNDLEKLVAELNLSGQVKFLGLRNDMPSVFSTCDGFCHSAPYEPFGLVVIEAMFCGLPVIVPDSAGPKEIVQNEVTGLTYSPLNTDDLAKQMEKIVLNSEFRKRLSERGMKHARSNFAIDGYMKKIFFLYGIA